MRRTLEPRLTAVPQRHMAPLSTISCLVLLSALPPPPPPSASHPCRALQHDRIGVSSWHLFPICRDLAFNVERRLKQKDRKVWFLLAMRRRFQPSVISPPPQNLCARSYILNTTTYPRGGIVQYLWKTKMAQTESMEKRPSRGSVYALALFPLTRHPPPPPCPTTCVVRAPAPSSSFGESCVGVRFLEATTEGWEAGAANAQAKPLSQQQGSTPCSSLTTTKSGCVLSLAANGRRVSGEGS